MHHHHITCSHHSNIYHFEVTSTPTISQKYPQPLINIEDDKSMNYWLALYSFLVIFYVNILSSSCAFHLHVLSRRTVPARCCISAKNWGCGCLRMATSSSDLKNDLENTKPTTTDAKQKRSSSSSSSSSSTSVKETKKFKGISNNVVSRLAKAAKEAAAVKKKRTSSTEAGGNTNTNRRGEKDSDKIDSNEDEETLQNLSSISNLSNVIDEELLHPTDGYRPSRETDSIRVLLEHNSNQNDKNNVKRQKSTISSSSSSASVSDSPSSKKRKNNNNGNLINQTYNVAVVFARPLVEDKITIEYAFRLVSLAKAMKFEGYKPSLICFCGPSSSSPSTCIDTTTAVSVTSTGVEFLKHLCLTNEISLEGTDLCEIPNLSTTRIISQHNNDEYDEYDDSYQTFSNEHTSSSVPSSWSPSLLNPVARELLDQHYVEKWLEESHAYESEMDEYGMTRQEPRKKIHIHWKLFSAEYHLCNLNDIHIRSPRQSPLARLVHDLEHAASSQPYRRGIIQTSWSFHYSTYPYLISSNKKKMKEAFLGKCYLMAQSLVPLLVNLRGVAENSEFFQRDNYRTLIATRRSLATLLEQMNVAYQHNRERQTATMMIPPTLKVQLKKQTSGSSTKISSIEIHLESALLSLGRCCDLVRPAGTFSAQSVSRQEWKDALVHLQDFLTRIECSCDPDRPFMDQWDIKLIENQPLIEILS